MMRTLIGILLGFALITLGSGAWHIYDVPRVEFERLETAHLANMGAANTWSHGRNLVDHTFTAVVRPNNDTLYSSTFLDLSDGPLLLMVPETGERYYSVQFLDPMTEVYGVVSRRTHGGAGGTYAILPPGYAGNAPQADDIIEAPNNRSWVLVRFLIDGPEDLPAVHALQDQLSLEPASE